MIIIKTKCYVCSLDHPRGLLHQMDTAGAWSRSVQHENLQQYLHQHLTCFNLQKNLQQYFIFLFLRWLLVLMDGCLYIYSELDTESPARGGSQRNTSILIITGRVTLIVQACQSGWEEKENLRVNLGKFERK